MKPMNVNPENEYEIAGAAVEIVKKLDPSFRLLWLWYGMGLVEGGRDSDKPADREEARA